MSTLVQPCRTRRCDKEVEWARWLSNSKRPEVFQGAIGRACRAGRIDLEMDLGVDPAAWVGDLAGVAGVQVPDRVVLKQTADSIYSGIYEVVCIRALGGR